MASTFSPNLRLELIGTGDQQGTWGATTNTNLGTLLEEAIGGYISVTVSDAGDTTLTANNGSTDQSRNMVINLIGTISAARTVLCPAVEKLYVVRNATTGGFAVTFKVSGQTGVSIPNGSTVFVYVDGTDVRSINGSIASQSASNVAITGGTISGATISGGSISGITDLAVADGGTGASDASTARTNLGLAIGTNVQAYDATLQSLSALGTAADRIAYTTGVDTWAESAITAAGRAILDDADAAAQRTTLGAAALASPTFTGTPAAPTAAAYTNTTQIATTAQVYDTVSTLPYNYQGYSYTLAASDRGKLVLMDGTSTLTIPTYASVAIPVSTRIDVAAWASGVITISAASGVTLRSSGSKVKLSGPFSGATLIHMNLNEWLLIGDLA